ncbi:MAG: hypothetical protein IT495_07170 [Gammaproteobacteria bacterium]|nr:hypothetical protein [Gammaproteobacteria bacterium]
MDMDHALLDPAAEFDTPDDVVGAAQLAREQKIEILQRWAYDARELAVAEEEGMSAGANPDCLDAVVAALARLSGSVAGEPGASARPRRPT